MSNTVVPKAQPCSLPEKLASPENAGGKRVKCVVLLNLHNNPSNTVQHCTHFTAEETEAQRSAAPHPRLSTGERQGWD